MLQYLCVCLLPVAYSLVKSLSCAYKIKNNNIKKEGAEAEKSDKGFADSYKLIKQQKMVLTLLGLGSREIQLHVEL